MSRLPGQDDFRNFSISHELENVYNKFAEVIYNIFNILLVIIPSAPLIDSGIFL